MAITRVGNVYSLYRGGAVVASATDVSPDLPTSTGWQFSGRSGFIYQGFLDEVEVHDRALSASEIQAIFNAGSAGKCKDTAVDGDGDGFSVAQGDCDDTNAAIYPGAAELCNGADDNCNGQIDEGVQSTFYQDADGDGFGNPASPTQVCSAPDGAVANNTDCNDANAAIYPGATEVCNGVDDNCDGVNDIVGTAGADILTGTPGDDVIMGLGGSDIINGQGGNDLLCGGDGIDIILRGSRQ